MKKKRLFGGCVHAKILNANCAIAVVGKLGMNRVDDKRFNNRTPNKILR